MSSGYGCARAIGVALIMSTALSGCVAGTLLGGALATTGVSVAQERSSRQALDDVEIRVTLNNKLLNESYELFGDVSTEVVEGRVLLTGSVPRQEDRVKAAEIVWSTPNVVELDNELTIAGDEGFFTYTSDVWITTQLRGKILGDKYISGVNYYVETVNGVVHVTGVAQSERELKRVLNHAAKIDDVKEVVSHVLLKNDPRRKAVYPATAEPAPERPAPDYTERGKAAAEGENNQ